MKRKYPWKLGGPWYRQESIGGPAEHGSRPILQKYASADFVNRFLKEPQKSLKFIEEDFIDRINNNSIYAPVSPPTRQPGDALKLFLDSHSRFYLVVCELHCQAPGSPPVARDQVCEAGFVVRRRWTHIDSADQKNIALLKAECRRLTVRIGRILSKQQVLHKFKCQAQSFSSQPAQKLQLAGENALCKKLQELQKEYAGKKRKLERLLSRYQSEAVTQKWQANKDLKESGSWTKLTEDKETPANILEKDEAIFPLYPLIPDPADKKHTGQNRTLYFGVVPTSSGDFDAQGNPKFENEHSYSVRCFVRRHKEGCPKKSERADCPGEIIWSEATEGYKLAAFTDLDGCGHTPINIQLPNINDLKAQAFRGPAGKGLNVRINSPFGSMLKPESDSGNLTKDEIKPSDDQYRENSGQICFFSIPLITIVAFFVLRLFLPIVVFVFNLWFLLKLKICILPSLAVDTDMAADLDVYGPDFEAGLEAAITAEIKIGGVVYDNLTDLKDEIIKQLNATTSVPRYLKQHLIDQLDTDFNTAIEAIIDMNPDFADNPEALKNPEKLPQATDGLHYFDRVEPT
ncbi:MAG: hypothetical protein QTN59_04255 [Candidatus Electrothrix communis]|nr:MAG: hypothetical protein QTN59_04255 [Candidatus Electrothrix communis]